MSFFDRHLREAGEGYFEHLGYTLRVSGTLITAATVVVIHGVCPFVFTSTCSRMVEKLNGNMKTRKSRAAERRRIAGY